MSGVFGGHRQHERTGQRNERFSGILLAHFEQIQTKQAWTHVQISGGKHDMKAEQPRVKSEPVSRWLVWTALLLLFSLPRALQAGSTELASVQTAIQKSGARWTSGDTPISHLSPEERRKYLGGRPSLMPPPELTASSARKATNLPRHLDWRNTQGADWTTPVKDQGPCGSCWAFSSVGTMESVIAIRANNPALALNLSEQYVLSCSAGTCDGWWMRPAADFLRTSGAVDEGCLPYTGEESNRCSDRCTDWPDRVWKIDQWQSVPNDVEAIKSALNQQVLTTAFDVYTDFYYYTGGVYEHVWGEYEGGHAVVLVGYDYIEHAWIVKNSWDTSWGEEGYFKILWGDSDIGRDALFFEYSNPCDDDEDGYLDPSCGGEDCDDEDPLVHPGAEEICDGKDSDCDSHLPVDEADEDGDGWPLCNDCYDADAAISPGEVDLCGDGIDNDCSGAADDKDLDKDGDLDMACGGTDCDDENPATYLGAPEICDGLDSDYDGNLPQSERDVDEDTWLICAGDCMDWYARVHPGNTEACDNWLDDDCDGGVDGQDIECEFSAAGWSAATPADAASLQPVSGPPSLPASRIGNTALWLLLPLASFGIGRWLQRRQRDKR